MPVVRIMDRSELAENEWMIVAYNRILFDEKIESMPEDLGLYMAETLGKTVAEDIERGDDYFRFLEEKSGIV